MNINRIREIINYPLSDEMISSAIIEEIAKDKNVITTVLMMLSAERDMDKELISNMNLLLSKSLVGLEEPKFNKEGFMQKEIRELYAKYKGVIGSCFKEL